ncbi:hypothetical protein L2E82_12925 [Cichorium intybus]|uniref:Uncharacterized protein n=1 Tax=Cichorium intybus TaxID=13427 RepID=A0ACB9GHJ8_CICIN|nr:hypothetical protein L2E82_12925 [Cichorium intybus]
MSLAETLLDDDPNVQELLVGRLIIRLQSMLQEHSLQLSFIISNRFGQEIEDFKIPEFEVLFGLSPRLTISHQGERDPAKGKDKVRD